ncbi:MAG: ABC transporter permease subunit [Gammaproteobacteria bacterium]|nr:ABC transporter permease subunit [Gammaproteobacteria bacterium]
MSAIASKQLVQRFCVWLLAVAFLAPLLIGLTGTVAPAAGLVPSLAPGHGFSAVLNDPRFVGSVLLSLKTGLLSTVLVLLLTALALVSVYNTRLWRWLMAVLPPLLAIPHAAMAVGLVFLIAPSGWLVRLVSPSVTGWARPPVDWVIPDAGGWTLILGLLLKEMPFLLLASAAHLSSLNIDASMKIGRTLGYSPARCWSRLILPRLFPRIRLTVLVILAFNLSVVDMALLLGPGNPPTFSVMLMTLVSDPDSRAAASAGALLLAMGVAVVFSLLLALEWCIGSVARRRRVSGERGHAFSSWRKSASGLVVFIVLVGLLSLLVLPLWSVAKRWRFPDTLPSSWTSEHWLSRSDLFFSPMGATVLFAFATCLLALMAAVAWLELERVGKAPKLDWFWYLPLLVPQVSLLFGWQMAALLLRADGQWLTVVYAHWIYSLPYVILILAVSWREFDPNWHNAAAVLGAGYWRILFRVRIPLLIKPLAMAAAVAVAVSVAQYLPTLLLGAGRHQTLAIELVTSYGGVDRRTIATLALLQGLLPLLAFVGALVIPSRLYQFGPQRSVSE